MRGRIVILSLLAVATCVGEVVAEETKATQGGTTMHQAKEHDGRRDFAFLDGLYKVHNRRLKERLVGSTEWIEFEATNEGRTVLDGLGSEDVYRTEYWPGFAGMAFRFFDPTTRRWAIYWADNRRGILEPPVYGTFDGDRGEFYGDDTHNGRPVRVRFLWTGVKTATPRWEQAFSVDGGKTWETNWVMDFTRP